MRLPTSPSLRSSKCCQPRNLKGCTARSSPSSTSSRSPPAASFRAQLQPPTPEVASLSVHPSSHLTSQLAQHPPSLTSFTILHVPLSRLLSLSHSLTLSYRLHISYLLVSPSLSLTSLSFLFFFSVSLCKMSFSSFAFPRVLYYLFWPQLSLLEQWHSPETAGRSHMVTGTCGLVTWETHGHEAESEDYSWN